MTREEIAKVQQGHELPEAWREWIKGPSRVVIEGAHFKRTLSLPVELHADEDGGKPTIEVSSGAHATLCMRRQRLNVETKL